MSLSGQLPLLIELARRDLWEKYSGSSLGALWSVIFPLVTVFIYLVVFANIMGARLPGSSNIYSYGVYLIAGIVPWTTFSSVVMRSSTVYLDRKNIISKIHVDLNCFPLYIVISESIIFGITLAIVLVFLFVRATLVFFVLVSVLGKQKITVNQTVRFMTVDFHAIQPIRKVLVKRVGKQREKRFLIQIQNNLG